MPARKLRPISRWISWCGRICLPAAASRRLRVVVARGSMPYSAVTQPRPVLRRNGGTFSSRLAVQSTWVSPMRIRQEPSAWRETPGLEAHLSQGVGGAAGGAHGVVLSVTVSAAS